MTNIHLRIEQEKCSNLLHPLQQILRKLFLDNRECNSQVIIYLCSIEKTLSREVRVEAL